MRDKLDEFLYTVDWKQAGIGLGALVGSLALVWAAWAFVLNREVVLPEIDSAEESAVRQVATAYTQQLGDFGLYSEKIDGDSVMNVSYIVSTSYATVKASSTGDANEALENLQKYMKPRDAVYRSVRDAYILPQSPLYVSDKDVQQWKYDNEVEALNTYQVKQVRTSVDKQIRQIADGVEGVVVDVSFDSERLERSQAGHDETWDGSWDVFSQFFQDRKMRLFMAKDGGNWKVYDQTGLEDLFLLANYKDPNSNLGINSTVPETALAKLVPSAPVRLEELNQVNQEKLEQELQEIERERSEAKREINEGNPGILPVPPVDITVTKPLPSEETGHVTVTDEDMPIDPNEPPLPSAPVAQPTPSS